MPAEARKHGPTPASPTPSSPNAHTSSRIWHAPASLRLSWCTPFPDQNGGASPSKPDTMTMHRFVYGLSSGARTPCPKQSRPKDGGVPGGVGTQGWSCFAHLLAIVSEFMAGRGASTRICLQYVCHGRGLSRTRSRPASHTCSLSVQCRSEALTKLTLWLLLMFLDWHGHALTNDGKPAASAACTFRRDPPGLSRHYRKHQSNNCTKCLYDRNRPSWKQAARTNLGLPHSWLQVQRMTSKY